MYKIIKLVKLAAAVTAVFSMLGVATMAQALDATIHNKTENPAIAIKVSGDSVPLNAGHEYTVKNISGGATSITLSSDEKTGATLNVVSIVYNVDSKTAVATENRANSSYKVLMTCPYVKGSTTPPEAGYGSLTCKNGLEDGFLHFVVIN